MVRNMNNCLLLKGAGYVAWISESRGSQRGRKGVDFEWSLRLSALAFLDF